MTAYDWDYLRHKYVSGDDSTTIESLSKLPNAPHPVTIKKRCSKEAWAEQRKQFRYRAATVATQSATGAAAIQQTAKLVDIAEVQARHIKLARSIQSVVARSIQKINQEGAVLSQREISSWIKTGTELERLAVGLATAATDINISSVDISSLSDEELKAIIEADDD
jgi:hypothetical protein